MNFKDLDFLTVDGMQIITALLANVGLDYATGDLYEKIQNIANEARKRGLLHGGQAYGDTDLMMPSRTGWEQTKGIQRRVLEIMPNVPITRD